MWEEMRNNQKELKGEKINESYQVITGSSPRQASTLLTNLVNGLHIHTHMGIRINKMIRSRAPNGVKQRARPKGDSLDIFTVSLLLRG